MSITFKNDVNVFDDGEFVGRIEVESGYQPVFFPIIESGSHLSIDGLKVITSKLEDLDSYLQE